MYPQLTVSISQPAVGKRLDRFVTELAARELCPPWLAELSRARIQTLVQQGEITVDGAPSKSSHKLQVGEVVCIRMPPPEPLGLVPESIPLDVLYEDSDIIAVNKAAGMVVHPGAGRQGGTLVHALLAHCDDLSGVGGVQRPGIVHRLDRGTSGVLVAAKHDRAHVALARQFSGRVVEKDYVAFVYGVPRVASDTLTTWYGRHPRDRKRFSGRVESNRRAITHYSTRLAGLGMSCLDVRIATGRTHQIRVHMFELGHPIVGDPLYMSRRPRRLESVARPVVAQLQHQALHAARLRLHHPISNAPLLIEAPLPADLRALLDLLEAGA